MNSFLRRGFAATAAAAMAVAAIAAAPADDMSVTVDGNHITVAGSLADSMGRYVIGTDAPDDAVGSGAGHDLAGYEISFPAKGQMSFHVALGDANPITGYNPQGMAIEITPNVGGTAFELTASATLDGGLEFGSQTCAIDPATNVNNCTTSPVDGNYDAGVLTWTINTQALPGSAINGGVAHSNYSASTGASGGVTLVNGILDDMSISALAAMPSARILIDGAVAGTGRMTDAGYSVDAYGVAAGDHAMTLELCGTATDFGNNQTDCTTVDLGTVTVS